MDGMKSAQEITAQEFGRLFSKFKEKYVVIAASYVRNNDVAEDIVSDSFAAFWDNRNKIELTSLPEAYILQSVKNRCLNHLRNRAVKMRAEQQMQTATYKALVTDMEILAEDDLGFLFEAEVAKIFKDFLNTLPTQTKDIFMDSRFRGLTYKEIAEKYGISDRKVKREISNVLSKMRISLKDYLPVLIIYFSNLL